MRIGLKTKLKKLEGKANMQYGTRIAVEYLADASGAPADAFMRDWLSAPVGTVKAQQRADLAPSRPIFARRVILVPTFSDWEAACLAQQKALQAVCRSRTNLPVTEAPSVGINRNEATNETAPQLAGTKRGRFIELADGRTFDRETGEFLEEPAKALPAGGLKATYQH